MTIPNNVKEAIACMENNGFEAYCVGGCVRDYMLGKKPYDFDIATSALPEETFGCFKDYRTLSNGIKHGTVSVIISSKPIEITTFRLDGEYKDNRHPENVDFTRSLIDDLARRDFTINAMAYSEKEGLCDAFGGEKDLKRGIIKCVGDANKRFHEDSLRILRGLRFSAVLDFKIEKKTSESIIQNMPLILNVSKERIYSEFIKILSAKSVGKIFSKYPSLLNVLFGITLNQRQKSALKKENSVDIKLAIIFINEENARLLKSLKPDNKTYRNVESLLENYHLKITNKLLSEIKIKQFLMKNKISAPDFLDLMKLKSSLKSKIDTAQFINLTNKIITETQCYTSEQLAISGDELIKAGLKGVGIRLAKENMLKKVINGELRNNKSELKKYVAEKYCNHNI